MRREQLQREGGGEGGGGRAGLGTILEIRSEQILAAKFRQGRCAESWPVTGCFQTWPS